MTSDTDSLLLRRKDVERLTQISRSAIYAKMSKGTFPRPYDVGDGSVRWRKTEVEEWIEKLPRA